VTTLVKDILRNKKQEYSSSAAKIPKKETKTKRHFPDAPLYHGAISMDKYRIFSQATTRALYHGHYPGDIIPGYYPGYIQDIIPGIYQDIIPGYIQDIIPWTISGYCPKDLGATP
jgi:hypothetical protein